MKVSEDLIFGYTFIFVGAEEYYVWLNNKLQTSKTTYLCKSSKGFYYRTNIVDNPAEYIKRAKV